MAEELPPADGRVREKDHALAHRRISLQAQPAPPWCAPAQTQSPMISLDIYTVALIDANPALRVRLGNPDELAELLHLATGLNMDGDELHRRGLACHTLERHFSYLHAGHTRQDDKLPERFFRSTVSGGPYQGAHLDHDQVEKMLDEYYAYLGWDIQTGVPTPETLKGLGI